MANDLTGLRFGRLVVMQRVASRRDARGAAVRQYACECDCGNIITIDGMYLVHGGTKSCGCLRRETTSATKFKHGMHGTKTYWVWLAMLNRCRNPNSKDYRLYGGRGIQVCVRWQDFSNFYADMGEQPPGLTIERVDNERGYSPDNCKWATVLEQARNHRPRKAA